MGSPTAVEFGQELNSVVHDVNKSMTDITGVFALWASSATSFQPNFTESATSRRFV